MTHPPTRPDFTVRGPIDLLALVPFMLGFHPTDSIVVVALDDGHLIFQARGDLPEPHLVDLFAGDMAATAARHGANSVIIIGYGDPSAVAAVLAMSNAMHAAGVAVEHMLRVHRGRYWELLCEETGFPPEGIPYDLDTHEVTTRAVYSGLVALPDREALSARLAPLPDRPDASVLDEQVTALGGIRNRIGAARRLLRKALKVYGRGDRPTDDELLLIAALMADLRCRDEAYRMLVPGEPNRHHAALWLDAVRRAPEVYVPGVATMLAIAAWRSGDGALASVAVERALAVDPDYRLALLVGDVLQAAVPPWALDDLNVASARRVRSR